MPRLKGLASIVTLVAGTAPVLAQSMLDGTGGFAVSPPLFTVGASFDGYTPPGILDGLGAYSLRDGIVRVLANHELGFNRGYPFEVSDGSGGTYVLTGARISYFDVDAASRRIVGAGPAFDVTYDQVGSIAVDASFLANDAPGLSRLCSSALIEPHQFGDGRGLEDRIFFTGEEDGGNFNPVGGNEWALDPATRSLWALPALGRGAWENVTEVDTGRTDAVAFVLADDTSPFDANPAAADGHEAAPLYLYVGEKDPAGDFAARNGLRDGTLFVWVSDTGETTPLDFNGSGTLAGRWVQVSNAPAGAPSEDGSTGFDEWGYPTQRSLWVEARALGAFGFSRPEDLATDPADGTRCVLASTGVDTYAVDPLSGDGVDTFGTLYVIDFDFTDLAAPTSTLTIVYDGDADPTRALRSPDNLEWADDGFLYVQEDKAETDTLSGELLFGPGAVNPNEAGIVRVDPDTGATKRVANIDRSVVLDASIANPADAVDLDAGTVGAWESSGIVDVSSLFGRASGTLFLVDVQAHGIDDQEVINPTSRLSDGDLVEGGQLLLLGACPAELTGDGTVGFEDLVTMLASWGDCDACPADLDGDGLVGATDLTQLLGDWGPCF